MITISQLKSIMPNAGSNADYEFRGFRIWEIDDNPFGEEKVWKYFNS